MKPIEPIIMDTNFKKIGIIDDYASFIWTTRYYTPGDFELCVDIDTATKELLIKDYYVVRDDDENIGIIENIEIQRNEDSHEFAIISGRFLSSIIGRRIIEKQTQLDGTVSNGIHNLLLDNLINPIMESRVIYDFVVEYSAFDDRLKAQYTGKNLLEVIQEICATYQLGFTVTLTEQNKFSFKLYKGEDRSYNQNINPHAVFSDTYDNLLSSNYKENYQESVTDVLVAGEGEGLDRKTLWATKENKSGMERRELYHDQRNLSTNDGEINNEEYEAQLKEEGLENITPLTVIFNGTVYFDNIEYKKDVFVGDVCAVENTRWNIYINSRLVEVIESVSEAGEYTINPTFGL